MAVTESSHLASRKIDDLYRAHGADVYRYAFAVLGNQADAEDITQTTFLNAYRSLEQGVRPRKPSNWLLTIASNAIKQRFRQEQSRPRYVELDDRIADTGAEDDEGPTVGELLTALSKIPPQQRQAIVLREFEGRSYAEVADILSTTTTALETLLFRARRSLAEELQSQLTCTEAQLAISRSVDGRLGRKERRRLRDHLTECPDCARFARMQQRNRSAIRSLALVPIPLSLTLFKGLEGTASAAVLPIGAGAAAAGSAATVGAGLGSGGLLAGGIGLKTAAVVAAASVAGGVGIVGAADTSSKPSKPPALERPGARLGQVAPRGVLVPGNGVAVGKGTAPGQTKTAGPATGKGAAKAPGRTNAKRSSPVAKGKARGQAVSATKRKAAATKKAANSSTAPAGKGTANPSATPTPSRGSSDADKQPAAQPSEPKQSTSSGSSKPAKPAQSSTAEPSDAQSTTAPGNGSGGGSKQP